MEKKKCFSQIGFTLTEVLVALVIITILVTALVPLFSMSFSGIFDAGRNSETQFLIQEEIEKAIAGDSTADASFSSATSIEGVNGIIVEVEKQYQNGKSVPVKTFLREQPVWLQFELGSITAYKNSPENETEKYIDVNVIRKGVLDCVATVECFTVQLDETNSANPTDHYTYTREILNFVIGDNIETIRIPIKDYSADPDDGVIESYAVLLKLENPTADGEYTAQLGTPKEAMLFISEPPPTTP